MRIISAEVGKEDGELVPFSQCEVALAVRSAAVLSSNMTVIANFLSDPVAEYILADVAPVSIPKVFCILNPHQ